MLDEQKKEISICAVSSTEKKLVIPSELDGYRVRRIGYPEGDHYEAAKKIGGGIDQYLEEIVIPDTVQRIQALSFYECKQLSKVTLPENITLGYASFSGCDRWKDIVLPHNTSCEDSALPGNAYRYTWNKTKTTVYTCEFNKKWKKSAKEVSTVYNVYGKKTKKGAYKFLAATKAKKFITACKYVKVMPAAEW